MIVLYNKGYNDNNNNQHLFIDYIFINYRERNMKTKRNYIIYLILLILVLGIAYTACKDITPDQEKVVENIELKLNK